MKIADMSYSQTYSIQDGQSVVRKPCSFKTSPSEEASRCWVHEGKLIDSPMGRPKMVVKVYKGSGQGAEVSAEMEKARMVRRVLKKCPPLVRNRVKVADTYQSSVMKVGRLGRKEWVSRYGKERDVEVLVQDFVLGRIVSLFSLHRHNNFNATCSGHALCTSTTTSRNGSSSPVGQTDASLFLKLAEKCYEESRAQCVIGEIQGAMVQDPNGNGLMYQLTSLTLHSLSRQYGQKDLGREGVEVYEQFSGKSQPRVPASAPPMEEGEGRPVFIFDELDCLPSSFTQGGGGPPSYRDNIFLPQSQPPSYTSYDDDNNAQLVLPVPGYGGQCLWPNTPPGTSSRPQPQGPTRHCTNAEGGRVVSRRQTFEDLLATTPELRSICTSSFLTQVLGPVPDYS